MDIWFSLALVCGIVVGGTIALLAGIGIFVVCLRVWRSFAAWAAKGHVNNERRRAKSLVARQRQLAAEREEATLRGATAVANQLVQTVVDAQLRHLAVREDEHRQQFLQLMRAIAHQPVNMVDVDTEWPKVIEASTSQSLPSMVASPQQGRGMLSSLRRMLFANAAAP